MVAERGTRPPPDVDTPVPQMAERLLEVPKIIPQDRIQQQTVEQFVDSLEVTRANLAEAEKSLAALMTSQAVSKSNYTQVASDHEASVKVFAEELKAWTEATQVLQSETDGADGHTYSLFQENPNAALQTPTDLKGFDMMTAVRQLAEQEHSTALAQLASCISAIIKFGADADNDLFVKVKDLITDLIRSQADAPPETNQKSHCDEETSKATEKKEDRDLFSVAYKNAVDNRRAAWRVITSVRQKKKSKSEEQLASYAREYIAKVENELQKIREGVLALMDKKLVPSPSTDESKAFYYKMNSDYHRYLAEQDTEVPKTSSRDRTLQQQNRFPMFQCRRPFPETESSSGLWSRSLTLQSRRLWRNWQRSPGFSPRTGFNNVLWSRPSKFLLFHSMRRSLRFLSLGRRNRV